MIAATDLKEAFLQARDLDASMGERLGVLAEAMHRLTPSSVETIDRLINRLKAHNAGESAPKPGEPMPSFVLPDETGRLVNLASLIERGPAIVTFHRGHWCPWCRISINTLSRAQARITAAGASMVAIVPDREQFAAEMKSDSKAAFPILTDMDNGYAMSLNLAIWVGTEMEQYMAERGNVLPKFQGNDAWMLPIPATFVVAQDGFIKARFVDPDYRKRMAIEDLLAALA
ncbi:MAG: peroxiredoxin-like family protein [Pseudorhodoplanes sp.]